MNLVPIKMVLPTLNPGEVIGPYKVEGELGRGQYGIAYLAWDTVHSRDVVLKHASASREVGALQKLSSHPYCAAFLLCLHEVIRYGGRDYLVLEYIPGTVLEYGDFPLEKLWLMLGELLQAITYIHSQGYTHGDIHDRNIMWTGTEVKLIDFGRAGESPPGDMSYRYDVVYVLAAIMNHANIPAPLQLAFLLRKRGEPMTFSDYQQRLEDIEIPLDPIREKMIQIYLLYQELSKIPDLEHLSGRLLEKYQELDQELTSSFATDV